MARKKTEIVAVMVSTPPAYRVLEAYLISSTSSGSVVFCSIFTVNDGKAVFAFYACHVNMHQKVLRE